MAEPTEPTPLPDRRTIGVKHSYSYTITTEFLSPYIESFNTWNPFLGITQTYFVEQNQLDYVSGATHVYKTDSVALLPIEYYSSDFASPSADYPPPSYITITVNGFQLPTVGTNYGTAFSGQLLQGFAEQWVNFKTTVVPILLSHLHPSRHQQQLPFTLQSVTRA